MKPNKTEWLMLLGGWFAVVVGMIAIVLFFTSCTTAAKATRYMDTHGEDAARYCAIRYPVKDSVGKDSIVYIKADNADYSSAIDSLQTIIDRMAEEWTGQINGATDTVQFVFQRELLKRQKEAASLKQTIAALKANYVPCKPDTIKKETIIYRENTAKVQAFFDVIGSLKNDTARLNYAFVKEQAATGEAKQGRNKWRLWCLITWALIAAYGFLRFRKLIPF